MELLVLLVLVALVMAAVVLVAGHARSRRSPGWVVRRSVSSDTPIRLWWPESEEPVPRGATLAGTTVRPT